MKTKKQKQPTPQLDIILGPKIRETSEPFVLGARRHQYTKAHYRLASTKPFAYNGAQPC